MSHTNKRNKIKCSSCNNFFYKNQITSKYTKKSGVIYTCETCNKDSKGKELLCSDNDEKEWNDLKPETKIHNIKHIDEKHFSVPPQNMTQFAVRRAMLNITSKIKEPHCMICGDTSKDGILLKIKISGGGFNTLCEDCYTIQCGME